MVLSRLPKGVKQRLKLTLGQLRKAWVDRFAAYTKADLAALLDRMKLGRGDVVLMHSAYSATNGFTGSPRDVIDAVLEQIGHRQKMK